MRAALTLAVCATNGVGIAQAAVVKLSIESRTLIAARAGEWPTHELIRGRYGGELDPADAHNSVITDLSLAPRNTQGKVEYSATFALTRPLNSREASGVLFYDTPNRGNATAVVDAKGHMHLVSGWQGDIPPAVELQTATVPVARNADGSPVTAPVFARFVDMPAGAKSLPIVGGIGAGVPRPEPVSLDSSQAKLIRLRSDTKPGELLPASHWAFADCSQTPFPGVANPKSLCIKEGFDPAFAYELTYTGKDPPVLGIGFAAVRDLVAFLRYSAGTAAAPNPIRGQVHHAIGAGVSQSGNFIRSFIRLGFNASEDGRIVFNGANAHIAARQVPLNLRFGVPGGAANRFEPGSEGVLWWGAYADKTRGRGQTSLLDRCTADHTCPKIFETFTAAELWGLRMSPDLVGLDARADIPLPENVRRYYFPGTTHGGGAGGFESNPQSLPQAPGCGLAGNPNPAFYTMRALTQALVDWVVEGSEPPPSRYPRLSEHQLVRPTRVSMGFPVIPGAPAPDGKLNPMVLQDFGPGFRADDLSGVMSTVPPKILGEAVSLVPRVDADGNETSGIPSVQHRVPLGTYLGWNVQAVGYYRGAGCGFQGGYIPFAKTRNERMAANDPRPSLEERYGTHAAFVEKVKAAAAEMVNERFLMPEDMQRIVADAEASNVLTQ
jgi:hypothetical protein